MISSQRLIGKAFSSIISLTSNSLRKNNTFSFANDNKDDKTQKYQYPFNFNRQQYRGYIKKVQKAKKQVAQAQQRQQGNIIPRRKRRVYDKPKFDTDLTNYAAWRIYDPEQTHIKLWQHALPVKAKVKLQPKWVIHAFGQGLLTQNNVRSSHRQYIFEDNNFCKFLLYEYRNTTYFKPNEKDFDYQNQQHLRPQMRKVFRLSPQQFWNSQQFFEFRLNSSQYAEDIKFCKWIQQTIQKRKSQQSYDQMIDKKFSTAFSFNQKSDMQCFVPNQPYIKYVTAQSFQAKKQQKPAKGKKQKQVEPAQATEQVKTSNYAFTKVLDQKFRKQVTQKKQKKVESL